MSQPSISTDRPSVGPSPSHGLWVQPAWATWLALPLLALGLVYGWQFLSGVEVDGLTEAVGAGAFVLVGVCLGTFQRDLSAQRMVRRHMAAVHPGYRVASWPRESRRPSAQPSDAPRG